MGFVDYGTLTLLFQDSVGGLEVQNPHTMEYQAASPIVCLITRVFQVLQLRYLFISQDPSS